MLLVKKLEYTLSDGELARLLGVTGRVVSIESADRVGMGPLTGTRIVFRVIPHEEAKQP